LRHYFLCAYLTVLLKLVFKSCEFGIFLFTHLQKS
jgi:hypothetical protein